MSGIEKLKERIIKEAEEASAEILANAEKEANIILSNSEQEADAKKSEILENAQKTAEANAARIISTAQMQSRNLKLQTMQELIGFVFDKSAERIKSLDNKQYLEMLFRMIIDSVITGDEEIILSENDRIKIDNDFMYRLNSELKNVGKKGLLKLSQETRDIQGGFILRSKGIEINSSIEAIIRSLRDDIEQEIASILFTK